MKPSSADPSESGGEEFSLLDDEADILEASNHISIHDNRDGQLKVDAGFFNAFQDDFDESDMNEA